MTEEYSLTIRPFAMGTPKEAAVKVLEEAAESFAEYQGVAYCLSCQFICADCETDRGHGRCAYKYNLANEIADTIQAACNLAARYDLDIEAAMERCEQRNRGRGRYEVES
jgi:phosphoribosyl-ATP pyrophosphohydrolase